MYSLGRRSSRRNSLSYRRASARRGNFQSVIPTADRNSSFSTDHCIYNVAIAWRDEDQRLPPTASSSRLLRATRRLVVYEIFIRILFVLLIRIFDCASTGYVEHARRFHGAWTTSTASADRVITRIEPPVDPETVRGMKRIRHRIDCPFVRRDGIPTKTYILSRGRGRLPRYSDPADPSSRAA